VSRAGAAAGRFLRLRARPLAALALGLGALIGLQACAEIDATQRRTCESIVPVIEPDGAAVTLVETQQDPTRPNIILVRYRSMRPASEPAPDEEAAPAPIQPSSVEQTIACAFGGVGFEAGKATLIGVETPDERLSETKLAILNRFWLRDTAGIAEVMRKVEREDGARPRGLFAVDHDQGYFLQQLVNGMAPAALYALLAVAYSLVYGLTDRINLAFGDLATLGAFACFTGVSAAVVYGAGDPASALPLGFAAAAVLASAWSRTIGETVFRPLVRRASQPLLVATIGLSIALQEFIGRAQGVRDRWLPPVLGEPHLIAHGGFEVVATTMQLMIGALSLALGLAVIAAMRLSRFGRAWRAVADDHLMARLSGIDPSAVLVATFALAGMLAGVAGAIVTVAYGGTNFHMGTVLGLKALVAAIVGGIGSLPGALIGGLLVGLVEAMWSAYQSIEWRDAVVLALLAVFLVLKPEGLLGTRRAVDERLDPR
jgi:branched-chain amino acid transport system permease protein